MQLEVISEHPASQTHDTPILFVHGAWHAAWCWCEHFVPFFVQQGFTCHALSLRGHGASAGHDRLRRTSIKHYVEDLAQVIEQLDRAPILVAHSMGTLVVQRYLESHATPAAVLLACVPPHGVIQASLRALVRHPLAFLKTNLMLSLKPLVGTPELARDMLFSKDMPAEKANAIFPKLEDESYRAFLDMMLFALPRPKRVATKMLVLGAASDRIFSPKEIESTARAYHAQHEIFPNMGHDMMIDIGWQAVADRILRWLSENNL